MYLGLELIKKHLNIDAEFHDDDAYLEALSDVVEAAVERFIDAKFCSLMEDGELPKPIIHACLLLLGNYYMSRESISFAAANEVPLSFSFLADLYHDYKKKC